MTARGVGHAFDSRLAHRVKPNAARHSLGARPDVYARSVKTTVASVLLRPGYLQVLINGVVSDD